LKRPDWWLDPAGEFRLILFHDRDPFRPGAPSTYRPDALIASAAGLRLKPASQKVDFFQVFKRVVHVPR
jgi:hypothetical protein